MSGDQDFLAQEQAEVSKLLAEVGAPGNPNKAPAQEGFTAPQPQPGQQQPAPQAPAPEPIQEDNGLSTAVFTPPNVEQYAQDPAQQAPAEPTPAGDPQNPNQPPPGVLEERQRRQKVEAELQEQRAAQQRLTDRLDMMNQVIYGQQQARLEAAAPPPPDPQEDLPGYVEHLNKQYTEQVGQIQEQLQQAQQQQQQQQAIENLRSQSRAQAEQFAQQHQDFGEAYSYYRQSRAAELRAQGFDDQTIAGAVEREELNLASAHLQSGRNVAEALYNAAKVRGYSPKAPAQQQQQSPAPAAPAYQQPAPQQQFQAPQPGQPGYQQPMEQMQAGMMASQSLANVSQAGAASPTTLEAYASMSDAQFAQHMENVKAMLQG